jgi:hypothetical protein
MKTILLFLSLVTIGFCAQFNAGDSVVFEVGNFNEIKPTFIPAEGVPVGYYFLTIGIAGGSFDAQSEIDVRFYEDDIGQSSFDGFLMTGGDFFNGFDYSIGKAGFEPFWRDLQGAIKIEVLSGSIGIEEIFYSINKDGLNYSSTVAIPEPSSYGVIIGISALLITVAKSSRSRIYSV